MFKHILNMCITNLHITDPADYNEYFSKTKIYHKYTKSTPTYFIIPLNIL